MQKFTKKQLKGLVSAGAAIDVTNATGREAIPESYMRVGYAAGVNGLNGLLLLDESGRLYAVTDRTTAVNIF